MIDDKPLLTRVLLVIWWAGTSTYTLSLLLAPPPDPSWPLLWSVSGVAYVMCLFLTWRRTQLPEHAADLSGYLCCTLATLVVAASHDPATPFCLFYLWVTVVSCHFLPVRRAVPQVVAVTPCYALALALTGGVFPWLRWALLSLTVAVVGISVTAMRARLAALVGVLADSARTDALTGLKNRRAFEETLAVELERAARTGETVALVIGDLDHFKAINDDFGHPTGDEVLRRAAKAVEGAVRRVDVPFRIGGEEFAVIVPATDLPSAHLLAERVREAVAAEFTTGGPREVTMSVGVAAYPEHGPDAVSLMAHADNACYQAKARGRNRSVTAPRVVWTPALVPVQRVAVRPTGSATG
ncbi:MAG TPA: GGDEF domain-containing protein [Mycobacteriales bacterium]|nr:GGDEF domain-containing protein [Mycobacteriales bacterium]